MLAVSILALAAWVSDRHGLFVFCLLWLPLIREDGGFYAAFTCFICIALEYGPRRNPDSRTLRLGGVSDDGELQRRTLERIRRMLLRFRKVGGPGAGKGILFLRIAAARHTIVPWRIDFISLTLRSSDRFDVRIRRAARQRLHM
jgi:hypothetical protein